MSNDWHWPNITTKTGQLDDVLKITAAPGEVSVSGVDLSHYSWTLTFPCAVVDVLIKRLEAARDAAALMESSK